MEIERKKNRIRFILASDMEQVAPLIDEVRGYLRERGVVDAPPFILTIRELVNNGIEHGNKSDTVKKVIMDIEEIGNFRFKISVKDEGEGFEHASINLSMPDDPSQVRNRGLALVNTFADELAFNDAGNVSIAYMTIKNDTFFTVDKDGNSCTIRPVGDLTGKVADELRTLLLDSQASGVTSYNFDFSDVEDIDSITLSIFVLFANNLFKDHPDGSLLIRNANSDIVNMFQLTRLDRFYKLVE
ncbi:MAG: ATP-binding protein [Desulfovibrio sp.]